MSSPLPQIISELDRLLEPDRFEDYGPNGLQVPGKADVTTIATGVSASVELFEQAVAQQADLVLVHHGLFWGSGAGPIDLALKRRLEILFDADMGLAAYHLPLDAHPEVGNNALLARSLGAFELQPFACHKGVPIGFLSSFPDDGIEAEELFSHVGELCGQEPLVFDCGPAKIKHLGIVSGGGTDFLTDAIAAQADAFLTGEPSERAMAQAREASIHYIAAGHYATETFGIKRIGEHLAEQFGLSHSFIDIPNPI